VGQKTKTNPYVKEGVIMDLMRWDPFRDISTLQDRINRAFQDLRPRSGREEALAVGERALQNALRKFRDQGYPLKDHLGAASLTRKVAELKAVIR